ncbi:MAG: VWA domain-containing protein [Phycisphaeraceae bacterium]|nr:MAG: VWA domain-containing protein [Phycisphaeraceae bacterium]
MSVGALLLIVTTFAVITGISSAWLIAGGAALTLPVAAHLLSRRPARVIQFPAVRFVKSASSAGAGRRSVRDGVLLMLRCLLVAALALAFARPSWTGAGAAIATDGAVDLVIVVDSSASMTRADRGRTLFDTARAEAMALLDGLDPARDRAAVVFARLRPTAALPELTTNFEALATRLAGASPTLEHADIIEAIAHARSLGAAADDERRVRRIVVISDMQRGSWERFGSADDQDVVVRPVGPGKATSNIAIRDVRITPARPVIGERVQVYASALRFGDAPDSAMATLRVGDRTLESRRVDFDGEGVGPIAFETVLQDVGPVALSVSIDDDSFEHDDRVGIAVEVSPKRRVGVVSGGEDGVTDHAARALAAALAPDAPAPVEVVRLSADRFDEQASVGLDALFIIGAGRLPEQAVQAIGAHLERGAGVVWFADSPESIESLMRVESQAMGAAPPIEFTSGFQRDMQGVGLNAFTEPAPALPGLAGIGARALQEPSFMAYTPGRVRPGAVPLLNYDSGVPFAAGAVSLIVVNADIAPDASTLTRSLVFPVLVHEWLAYLSQSASDRDGVFVGESIHIESPIGDDADIVAPLRDESGRIVEATATGGVLRLQALPTSAPGFVRITDSAGDLVAMQFVALDPRQSDMRIFNPGAGTGDDVQTAGDAEVDAARSLSSRADSIELWPFLLTLAIGFALLESLLAGAPRGRRRTEPVS